uniref:Succinate dehydrogenase assembly factor 4, mitochondrial n=1 Tax=Globodera rostochiensis TaxID=31243 RepID=A0A914GTS0_GLORO
MTKSPEELGKIKADDGRNEAEDEAKNAADKKNRKEFGGPAGPEPTRYGDWERKGRVRVNRVSPVASRHSRLRASRVWPIASGQSRLSPTNKKCF